MIGDPVVCPSCSEPAKAAALFCAHCRSPVAGGKWDAGTRSDLAASYRLWQQGPAPSAPSRRRISVAFWIAAAVVLLVAAFPAFLTEDATAAARRALVHALLTAWIPLVLLALDLTRVYPETGTGAAGALRGFAQALHRGNWKLAREFVAAPDLASPEIRNTPATALVTPESESFTFDTEDGFCNYWRHLIWNSGGRRRHMRVSAGEVRPVGPGLALGELRVTVWSHLTWWASAPVLGIGVPTMIVVTLSLLYSFGLSGLGPAFVGGIISGAVAFLATKLKYDRFDLSKLLIRKGNRWCVANGECRDTPDRALKNLLMAR